MPQLLGTPNQAMIGNVIQSKVPRVARLSERGGALVHPHGVRSSSRFSSTREVVGTDDGLSDDDCCRARAAPRLAPASAHARGGSCRRHTLTVLRLAGGRLPDAADRGRHRFLLQRSERPLQLHLGGLHVQELAPLGRLSRNLRCTAGCRSRLRWSHLRGDSLGTLMAMAIVRHRFLGRVRRISSSSCRCRRPRSFSARRS